MTVVDRVAHALRELGDALPELARELRRLQTDARRDNEYVSTTTAAKLAGVTAHTIRRYIREGKLSSTGGRRHRIPRGELEAFLRDGARDELTPEAMARRDFA